MRKIFPIILVLGLLVSCSTTYTLNPTLEENNLSLGLGGSYLYHSKPSGWGWGFNVDLITEFFESETSDRLFTYRGGFNIEYEKWILSLDYNVKYKKEFDYIEYRSLYSYPSIEIGYNISNKFHLGIDINAKKEITLFCRFLYVENHI